MAHAFADQMKGLALRHSEKAVVALASMLFFFCVATAATKKPIDTTPEQINKAAQQSESNLNRKEEREAIIKRLEETDKITETQFAKTVEEQTKVKLVADAYKTARQWVTPEPGAGMIRDQPTLIAPAELYAYPGRGGLLVYALDEKGERIPQKEGEEQEKKPQRYGNTKKPRRGGGMGGRGGGMMGGMMGQRKKKRQKSKVEEEREKKEERAREAKRLKALIAGKGALEETKEAVKEAEPPAKEITKGYRWVVITGVLDHAQMLANYREALKNPAVAYPNYRRLDLQRKTLQPDGTWSDWRDVDEDKNLEVLDNVPEVEDELTPESVRPVNLVDPLPFLKAGLWEKVHIASLVPKEKQELPPEPTDTGGMAGMMSGGRGGMGMGMMMGGGGGMPGMGGGSAMMGQVMGGMAMADAEGGMMGGSGMMGRGMGMGMMMGGGSETAGTYWKSDAKKVMIRALDFTPEPDTIYRYRVRIVVYNPNHKREDVNYGVNTQDEELKGPWSQETDLVHMPPDVQPYATGSLDPNPHRDRQVRFQVVRFNPGDGWTVPRNFEASAGDIIGYPRTAQIPDSEGNGQKGKTIDFSSRQIVLDVKGGGYQQLPGRLVGPPIERPVLSLLLRPDGSVVLHKEADDEANEVRRDIEANYTHELKESDKERKNSQGSSYSDMMGGMPSGMMDMMRGMERGGGGRR